MVLVLVLVPLLIVIVLPAAQQVSVVAIISGTSWKCLVQAR